MPVPYKNVLRVGKMIASYGSVAGVLLSTLQAKANIQESNLPALPSFTTIQFQTSAVRHVEQDILSARLQSWSKGPQADVVQNKINTLMSEALKSAKGNPNFTVSTGNYNVYHDEKQGLWVGSQTLVLQGNENTKSKSFSEFVGGLQKKGWALESYGYELSFAKRQSLENEMRAEIIKKSLYTAKNILSPELGRNFVRFSQIDFDPMPFGIFQARVSKSYSSDTTMAVHDGAIETAPVASPEQMEVVLIARVSGVFE